MNNNNIVVNTIDFYIHVIERIQKPVFSKTEASNKFYKCPLVNAKSRLRSKHAKPTPSITNGLYSCT